MEEILPHVASPRRDETNVKIVSLHLTLPGKRKKNNEIEIQVAKTGTEKPVESRDGTGKGIETFNLMTFTEKFSDLADHKPGVFLSDRFEGKEMN
jgi:hypothetical protein